jgi:hypothetical protein
MTAARRKAGPIETAARRDLRALPGDYAKSAIGASYVLMARRMDFGVSARDAATLARELRMALLALYDLAPPARENDPMDDLRARRENRMATLPRADTA